MSVTIAEEVFSVCWVRMGSGGGRVGIKLHAQLVSIARRQLILISEVVKSRIADEHEVRVDLVDRDGFLHSHNAVVVEHRKNGRVLLVADLPEDWFPAQHCTPELEIELGENRV